jgi:hypothetical protein
MFTFSKITYGETARSDEPFLRSYFGDKSGTPTLE